MHKIHLLMGVLIAFKCLTVLCQSGMYHLIRTRGDPEAEPSLATAVPPHLSTAASLDSVAA